MCRLKKATLLMLVTLLCGCQTLVEKQQATVLSDTLGQYESAVRWGGVEQARHFHQEDLPVPAGDTSDLRIMGYEVIQGPTMVSEDRALQTAIIQYIFKSRQRLKELRDPQIWQYDSDSKTWTRQNSLPEFR